MNLSLSDRFALLRGFLAVTRDPRNLDGVLDLADRIANRDGAFEHVPAELMEMLDGFECDDAMPPLAALRQLPPGTLGREYARFMDDNGLVPEALERDSGDSKLQAFRAHMRASHDLWHVATGWTPDLLGELGLQAFYLAQMRIPFPAFILAAGLLHVVWKAPEHFYEVVDAVAEGYRQGREARALAPVRWSERLATPVPQVQSDLGILNATRRLAPVIPLVA